MKLKDFIKELQDLQEKYNLSDDTEVLITDGWDCKGYRGDFLIERYIPPGRKTQFVDIGIGGCRDVE